MQFLAHSLHPPVQFRVLVLLCTFVWHFVCVFVLCVCVCVRACVCECVQNLSAAVTSALSPWLVSPTLAAVSCPLPQVSHCGAHKHIHSHTHIFRRLFLQ